MSRIKDIIEAARSAAMTGVGLEEAMNILTDIEKEGKVSERESKAIAEAEAAIKRAGKIILEEAKKKLAEEIYGKGNIHKLTKIAIIGTQGYYPEMKEHEMVMIKRGYAVQILKMDWQGKKIEDIIDHNKRAIKDADEVHLFWDGRSSGTILDLGMTIALGKPLVIMKLNTKSIPDYVRKYANQFLPEDDLYKARHKR